MWEFNLVVTMGADGHFMRMLKELERWGEFRKTEFFGVVLGRVADRKAFLETVLEKQSTTIANLGRVVPLDRVFVFHPENFLEQARQAILPCLDVCAQGRFYVRLERRGLKGQIVSPAAERALDAFVEGELARTGKSVRVDFADPDAIIALETIGERCGVGLLTREMMERYPFVRVG